MLHFSSPELILIRYPFSDPSSSLGDRNSRRGVPCGRPLRRRHPNLAPQLAQELAHQRGAALGLGAPCGRGHRGGQA